MKDNHVIYQNVIGSLCATDYKWIQREQVNQGKLVIDKMWNGIGGNVTSTIDAHYYLGCGYRGGKEREIVFNDTKVRRLTPEECELLQGYPVGYTNIGEWTDSKGKVHTSKDSYRYKALGNSIGIPAWIHIIKGISDHCQSPGCSPTMGSLFDGIGGFPRIWEHINGKGTARWASEIDEFCIAVTKKHYPEECSESEK